MVWQLTSDGADGGDVGARVLTPTLVRDADLIRCMTRVQRREVVLAAPGALRCSYTLTNFSDIATKMLSRRPPGAAVGARVDESTVAHIARVAVFYRDEVHARLGDEVDVADITGSGGLVYAPVAQQLRELLAPVVTVLRGSLGSGS